MLTRNLQYPLPCRTITIHPQTPLGRQAFLSLGPNFCSPSAYTKNGWRVPRPQLGPHLHIHAFPKWIQCLEELKKPPPNSNRQQPPGHSRAHTCLTPGLLKMPLHETNLRLAATGLAPRLASPPHLHSPQIKCSQIG